MDPQALAIILLFVGLLLLFGEFFIPSGGVIAVLCLSCLAGSVYYAYRAWFHSAPGYWWTYLASLMVLTPSSIYIGFKLLTSTSLGDRVFLRAPDSAAVTPHQQEVERLNQFVGQRGKTLSLMTPGGMVQVQGERLHASSEGLLIEAGSEVVIYGVAGTRLLVRQAEPEIETPAAIDLPHSQSATSPTLTPATDPGSQPALPLDPWIHDPESDSDVV